MDAGEGTRAAGNDCKCESNVSDGGKPMNASSERQRRFVAVFAFFCLFLPLSAFGATIWHVDTAVGASGDGLLLRALNSLHMMVTCFYSAAYRTDFSWK